MTSNKQPSIIEISKQWDDGRVRCVNVDFDLVGIFTISQTIPITSLVMDGPSMSYFEKVDWWFAVITLITIFTIIGNLM